MLHRNRWCWLVLLWAGLCIPGVQATESLPEDSSPATLLAAELAALTSMDAAFTQLTLSTDGRVLQENQGHLWVASPARFRIETEAPFAQTLVSDGNDFWSFDADLEQVIIQPLDKNVEQVPILLLGGDSAAVVAAYNVSYFEEEALRYFVLTPKSQATLFETLTVEFTERLPTAITITDAMGQQTRISFTEPQTNTDPDLKRFQFLIPDGVDVIDDRPPA